MERAALAEVENKRSLRVAFSSEAPVLRTGDGWDHPVGKQYWEVLDHGAGNADVTLLQNRGAFLDEHDPKSQIGVVAKAWIDDDRKGRADLIFGEDDFAKTRYQQMAELVRPHISFFYDQTRMLSESTGVDGLPVKRFAWRAHEISSVAMPADGSVGVGRSGAPEVDIPKRIDVANIIENLTPSEKTIMKRSLILLDSAAGGAAGGGLAAPAAPSAEDIRKQERARQFDITRAADSVITDMPKCAEKIRALANTAMESGMASGEFSKQLVFQISEFRKANPLTMAAMGVSPDQAKEYSFAKAVRSCVQRDKMEPDGFEGEVHQEMYKRCIGDFTPAGFLMPYDRPMRLPGNSRSIPRSLKARGPGDLQVGVFNQGGAVVQSDIYLPMIELLRNKMVTERLGVVTIAGLQGMILWPRHVSPCAPGYIGETGTLITSNPTLDQLMGSPHRVGVTGSYSKQLILQSSVDVENWLRDDQLKTLAVVIDSATLLGTGANQQPLGIFNTIGIGSVNFGGTPTYQKIVNFKTQLALANAAAADMAFVTTPAGEEKLRVTAKIGTTFPIFIWEDGSWGDDTADGRMIGLRATSTNQITNDRLGFGNFSDSQKLIWGGLDIVVNPYSRAKDAVVEITTNSWMDVMVRHQGSFAYSNDSVNQ